MAKDLPDALGLRELKYGAKTTDEVRIQWARRFEEKGLLAEALDLYLIAKDEKSIENLRRRAVEQGRPILLLILAWVGRHPTADEWKAAGDKAFADSRYREAYRAYTEAGHEPGLEQVREKLPGYELYVPSGD